MSADRASRHTGGHFERPPRGRSLQCVVTVVSISSSYQRVKRHLCNCPYSINQSKLLNHLILPLLFLLEIESSSIEHVTNGHPACFLLRASGTL